MTELQRVSEIVELPRNFDKKQIYNFLRNVGKVLDINEDLIFGVYNFFVIKKQLVHSVEDLKKLSKFIYRLKILLRDNSYPFKARSFNYITETQDIGIAIEEILFNIEYCISTFDKKLFVSKENGEATQRERILSYDIAGTDLVLTCKGGEMVLQLFV